MDSVWKLRNLQFDIRLTEKQRKLANELYKRILWRSDFPDVPEHLVQSAIKQVEEG